MWEARQAQHPLSWEWAWKLGWGFTAALRVSPGIQGHGTPAVVSMAEWLGSSQIMNNRGQIQVFPGKESFVTFHCLLPHPSPPISVTLFLNWPIFFFIPCFHIIRSHCQDVRPSCFHLLCSANSYLWFWQQLQWPPSTHHCRVPTGLGSSCSFAPIYDTYWWHLSLPHRG